MSGKCGEEKRKKKIRKNKMEWAKRTRGDRRKRREKGKYTRDRRRGRINGRNGRKENYGKEVGCVREG